MLRVQVPEGEDAAVYALSKMGSPTLLAARAQSLKVQYESESTLTPREREAMRYRLAHVVGCGHCLKVRMGRDKPGFSNTPIPEALYENVLSPQMWDGYSEREKLAIEFSARFAQDHESMNGDEQFWTRLNSSFDEREIADLCLLTGTWVATGFMYKILGLNDVCDLGREAEDPAKPRELRMGKVHEALGSGRS